MKPNFRHWLVLALLTSGWVTAAACATFTDALGREISLAGKPQRIVTLAPSLTEIVFFLGLGERVVGVTQFSYYPPAATNKPKVGSYVNLNVERILSLSPDLILGTADGNQAEMVTLLEQTGLPVYIVNPRNIRQVIDSIVRIGHVCGVPDRAKALAADLSAKVDAITARIDTLAKPLVFLQINPKPLMTVNKETYLHDLIRLAGGRNMAGDQPIAYPRISLEEVIQKQPEVIIVSSMARGGEFEAVRQQWMRWPIIPAVKNHRVHLVDSDLIDRPSPRLIQGLEILARHLHPEAAWED